MLRQVIGCAVAVALLGMGDALAAQPTPVPNVAPNFSSFSFLLGTWHCERTLPGRSGVRTETDTYTITYDGWQMQDHAVSPPFDKYRTRDDVVDSWVTYDPRIKTWVNQSVGNFGEYGLETSPGWVGRTIIWTENDPDGTTTHVVETKVSDTKETFKVRSTKGGQRVGAILTDSCSKS